MQEIYSMYKQLALYSYLLTDRNLMMSDFVEATYDLAVNTNNLIEVKFIQGANRGLQLGFTKLRSVVDSIMSDIRFYMEQFRPHIKDIKKYESSLRFLEENFIDKMLNLDYNKSTSLDNLSKSANTVLQKLTKPHNYDFSNLTYDTLFNHQNDRAKVMGFNFTRYNQYYTNYMFDNVRINEKIYYPKMINNIIDLQKCNAHEYTNIIEKLNSGKNNIDANIIIPKNNDHKSDIEGFIRSLTCNHNISNIFNKTNNFLSKAVFSNTVSIGNTLNNLFQGYLNAAAAAGDIFSRSEMNGTQGGNNANSCYKINETIYYFGYKFNEEIETFISDDATPIQNIAIKLLNKYRTGFPRPDYDIYKNPNYIMTIMNNISAAAAFTDNELNLIMNSAIFMISNKPSTPNHFCSKSLNYISYPEFEKEVNQYIFLITNTEESCILHEQLFGNTTRLFGPGTTTSKFSDAKSPADYVTINVPAAGNHKSISCDNIPNINVIDPYIFNPSSLLDKLFKQYVNVTAVENFGNFANSRKFIAQIGRTNTGIPFLPNIVKAYTHLIDILSSIGMSPQGFAGGPGGPGNPGAGPAAAAPDNLDYTLNIFKTIKYMILKLNLNDFHNHFLFGGAVGLAVAGNAAGDTIANPANAAGVAFAAAALPYERIQREYVLLISSIMNVHYKEIFPFVDYVKTHHNSLYKAALPAAVKAVRHYMFKNADPVKMFNVAMMQLLVNPFTISFFPGDSFKKMVEKDVLISEHDNDVQKELCVYYNNYIWSIPLEGTLQINNYIYQNNIDNCYKQLFDKKVNYNNAFSNLVFGINLDDEENIYSDNKISYKLKDQLRTARPAFNSKGIKDDFFPVVNKLLDNETGRFDLYNSDGKFNKHRNLIFAFNQLLALYLETNTDLGGGFRIYHQLINSIGNGTLSQAVTEPLGNTIPDVAALGESFGIRGVPKNNIILLTSLAYTIQRFIKDVNPSSQVPDHLATTLTDIPLYMKECYRANLPSFIKMFDFLLQKAEFIKNFIQKLNIDLTEKVTLEDICFEKSTRKFIQINLIEDITIMQHLVI